MDPAQTRPRSPDDDPSAVVRAKRELRARLLAERRSLSSEEASARAAALGAHVLALPELSAASTVAAYVSVGSEPPTGPVLDELHARGVRVLLPVLLPDGDLDWAVYAGAESLQGAGRGLSEPTGPRLGVDAVAEADVVLLPGLAASPTGLRMGRGGGSYDRALARTRPEALRVLLLHPDEVGLDVPAEEHDQPVHLAVTGEGVTRFGA